MARFITIYCAWSGFQLLLCIFLSVCTGFYSPGPTLLRVLLGIGALIFSSWLTTEFIAVPFITPLLQECLEETAHEDKV